MKSSGGSAAALAEREGVYRLLIPVCEKGDAIPCHDLAGHHAPPWVMKGGWRGAPGLFNKPVVPPVK
ncbi:hypothetical protein [Brucella pseudogrignonensis]|uniref:hypothetical protein n=1 Tax=Brucella pseudogrignonensis TaxID=419475 RepID=UPI0038D16BFC